MAVFHEVLFEKLIGLRCAKENQGEAVLGGCAPVGSGVSPGANMEEVVGSRRERPQEEGHPSDQSQERDWPTPRLLARVPSEALLCSPSALRIVITREALTGLCGPLLAL